jgi:hypothetical protein
MAKIPDDVIKAVLDATKIEDVISDFVTLRKAGVNLTGICPFHDDQHDGNFIVRPSSISPERGGNTYRCFACEAKGDTVKFLMDHENMTFVDAIRWLGNKYNIEVDDVPIDWTPPPPRPTPPPLPTLYIPMSIVKSRTSLENNTLVEWIRTGIKWDTVQRKRVDEVLTAYLVGSSVYGHTIFWQIDNEGKVRTGKMMKYRTDGHRDKTAAWNFDYIHAALFRDQRHPEYDDTKMEVRQCLFGLHLLNHYKYKDVAQTVCIVESEKTALLMAIAYGNNAKQVWMACGGLGSLNATRLAPLIADRRNIILYPDRDGIEAWRQKAEQLHYDRVTIDTTPVTQWWRPEDGEKADIADVVIRILNERQPIKTIADVKEAMPKAATLIDKMNLTIADDEREQ